MSPHLHRLPPAVKGLAAFYLPRLLLIAGLLLILGSLARYLFAPKPVPFSLQLESYQSFSVHNGQGCQPALDFIREGAAFPAVNEWQYPYQYEYPDARYQLMDIDSENPLYSSGSPYELRLGWDQMSVTIRGKRQGQEQTVPLTALAPGEAPGFISGQITQISGDFSHLSPLEVGVQICEETHHVMWADDYQLRGLGNSLAFFGAIPAGQQLVFEIRGALDLQAMGAGEPFDSYELSLKADPAEEESAYFVVFLAGDMFGVLPHGQAQDPDSDSGERMTLDADRISIHQPVGLLKLGNDPEVRLESLTEFSQQSLEISSLSVAEPPFIIITGDGRDAPLEISGFATDVILNGDQIGKVPWNGLPEYLPASLTGLVITLIGALFTRKQTLVSNFLIFENRKPPKGSFVCETRSGATIAGKLSRKPGKNYPFYLLKHARRKPPQSDQWEKDLIAEIKIREDAVEQTYFL